MSDDEILMVAALPGQDAGVMRDAVKYVQEQRNLLLTERLGPEEKPRRLKVRSLEVAATEALRTRFGTCCTIETVPSGPMEML